MRKIIIKYGVIAGITMAILMLSTTLFIEKIAPSYVEMIDYSFKIIGFLPIFLGVRKFRDDLNGGYIDFGKAAAMSTAAALLANLFYVAAWLFIYYNMPDFMANYTNHFIAQMKAGGSAQKDIDDMMKQLQQMKEMYKNPYVNAANTYAGQLFSALLFSLITGLLLRKKPPAINLQ